jgi:hypothetical protein
VRCKWGSVQEATALFELMHALPAGCLEEVGLCRVDPDALAQNFGFSAGQLPPLGASPDGLMRQRHPSPASAVCPVLPRLTAARIMHSFMLSLAGGAPQSHGLAGSGNTGCRVFEVRKHVA